MNDSDRREILKIGSLKVFKYQFTHLGSVRQHKRKYLVKKHITLTLVKFRVTSTNWQLYLPLAKNIVNIDELVKGALGMVEPRYEPRAEYARIHGNPASGNRQTLSHWQSTLKAQMALKANCMFSHSWQAKHVSPAKTHMRHQRAWSLWETAGQHWLDSNFA